MVAWSWLYEGADGEALGDQQLASAPAQEVFPSQSDAESWIGEVWPELLHAGVEQVTLREDDRKVYGPMSLRPTD
jgi:hypothetical protein